MLGIAVTPPPVGATIVRTTPYVRLEALMADAVDEGSILAVSGPVGVGKSLAVVTILEAMGRPNLQIHLPTRTLGYDFLREAAKGLGHTEESVPGRVLRERLLTGLEESRPIVAIDEADLLDKDTLHLLRWLHEHARPRFPLVLMTSELDALERKAGSIASRTTRRVEFEPLSGRPLKNALREHHPLFAELDDELLGRIDARFGGGIWRAWDLFLKVAAGHLAKHRLRSIDEQVAAVALSTIVGHDL